jgi:hypothetical protein
VRASLIALLLLASVGTASAECAWVLWIEWASLDRADVPAHLASGLIPLEASTTKAECERARAARHKQQTRDSNLFCLPDTIDPRRPKR